MDKVKKNIIELIEYIESLGYGFQGMYFGVDKVEFKLIKSQDKKIANFVTLTINKDISNITIEDINL